MSRKRARPAIRDVIAERVFHRANGREVRAQVGRPREVKAGRWECEFRVLGVGRSKVWSLPGGDSLEALQSVLVMMVAQLDSYQKEHGLTFMGESSLMLWRHAGDLRRRGTHDRWRARSSFETYPGEFRAGTRLERRRWQAVRSSERGRSATFSDRVPPPGTAFD